MVLLVTIFYVKNKDGGRFYFDTYAAAEEQAKSTFSFGEIYQTCLHCSHLISKETH